MEKNNPNKDLIEKAEKLALQAPRRWAEATVTILVVVGLFAVLGHFLDKWFGTQPILFIILIVLAFPISQYLIYVRLKKHYLDNGDN